MLNRVFTYISGIRIYTNIVSQRSDNRFYRYTICLGKLPVTQVWLAWRQAEPCWLLQTGSVFYQVRLGWDFFSWANISLRSCLIDWPRCSLLGQPQPEFSASTGLAWQSLTHLMESMNTGLCWLSLNTVLLELLRPFPPKEAVSH